MLLQGAEAVDLAHVWRWLHTRQAGARGIKGSSKDPPFNLPLNRYLKVRRCCRVQDKICSVRWLAQGRQAASPEAISSAKYLPADRPLPLHSLPSLCAPAGHPAASGDDHSDRPHAAERVHQEAMRCRSGPLVSQPGTSAGGSRPQTRAIRMCAAVTPALFRTKYPPPPHTHTHKHTPHPHPPTHPIPHTHTYPDPQSSESPPAHRCLLDSRPLFPANISLAQLIIARTACATHFYASTKAILPLCGPNLHVWLQFTTSLQISQQANRLSHHRSNSCGATE